MAKATITKAEYQQLLGLMLLARKHNDALRDIEAAAHEITGEQTTKHPWGDGHCGDTIYGTVNPDADELLRKLGITVAEKSE